MASAALQHTNEDATTTFGAWLLTQVGTTGLIGMLATGAKADRAFPKNGTVQEVRARLILGQADGDLFEALDDAELKWNGR